MLHVFSSADANQSNPSKDFLKHKIELTDAV